MAALETGQAIRLAIWTRITTGEEMLEVFSHDDLVEIYSIKADKDPPMPYMVDRLVLKGIYGGTYDYFLDLYDYDIEADPSRIHLGLDRLKILLHDWQITTAEDEIGGGVMQATEFGWGFVPTDNDKVMHYATQWVIRCGATRDRTNILG